jgi:hypothetical protein
MSKEKAIREFDELLDRLYECYIKFHEWEVVAPDDVERREAAYDAKDRRTEVLCRLMRTLEGLGYWTYREGHENLFSRVPDSLPGDSVPRGGLPHHRVGGDVDGSDGLDDDDVRHGGR